MNLIAKLAFCTRISCVFTAVLTAISLVQPAVSQSLHYSAAVGQNPEFSGAAQGLRKYKDSNNNWATGFASCSGVWIGGKWLLTAEHVIAGPEEHVQWTGQNSGWSTDDFVDRGESKPRPNLWWRFFYTDSAGKRQSIQVQTKMVHKIMPRDPETGLPRYSIVRRDAAGVPTGGYISTTNPADADRVADGRSLTFSETVNADFCLIELDLSRTGSLSRFLGDAPPVLLPPAHDPNLPRDRYDTRHVVIPGYGKTFTWHGQQSKLNPTVFAMERGSKGLRPDLDPVFHRDWKSPIVTRRQMSGHGTYQSTYHTSESAADEKDLLGLAGWSGCSGSGLHMQYKPGSWGVYGIQRFSLSGPIIGACFDYPQRDPSAPVRWCPREWIEDKTGNDPTINWVSISEMDDSHSSDGELIGEGTDLEILYPTNGEDFFEGSYRLLGKRLDRSAYPGTLADISTLRMDYSAWTRSFLTVQQYGLFKLSSGAHRLYRNDSFNRWRSIGWWGDLQIPANETAIGMDFVRGTGSDAAFPSQVEVLLDIPDTLPTNISVYKWTHMLRRFNLRTGEEVQGFDPIPVRITSSGLKGLALTRGGKRFIGRYEQWRSETAMFKLGAAHPAFGDGLGIGTRYAYAPTGGRILGLTDNDRK